MKKTIKRLLMLGLISSCILGVTACTTSNTATNTVESVDETDVRYEIYLAAVESGYNGSYNDWLKSIKGASVALQVKNGYIQMKYSNETEWTNLISLDSLKGDKGDSGRETEFRATEEYIQWRYTDGSSWENLIKISSLTGNDGREIELSVSNDAIVYRYVGDTEWTNIIDLATIREGAGEAKSAYEIACDLGFTGTQAEWIASLKGKTGENGKGITTASIDSEGHLIITYTDGTTEDAGKIEYEAPEAISDLAFYPLNDGTYAVGQGNSSNLSNIVIPETFNGKTVSKIEERGFADCDNLLSITIPDTITEIGDSAFMNCEALTEITIPSAITTINDYVFYNCYNLATINSTNLTSVGNYAFYSCESLKGIDMTELTSIGEYAFYACRMLTTVTFSSSLKVIGDQAFSQCINLSGDISFTNNLDSIGEYAFNNTKITTLEISYVKSISRYACAGCDSLTFVNIVDGLEILPEGMFYGCEALCEMILPDSLINIGMDAFYGCYDLQYNKSTNKNRNITYHNGVEYIRSSGGNKYFVALRTTDISNPKINKFDESTKIIAPSFTKNVYNDDNNLVDSIEIAGDVISIGAQAFDYCKKITSVTLPDSVKYIGKYAFRGISSLQGVTVGKGLKEIGDQAFQNCTSLTTFTIPANCEIEKVGAKAFSGCTNLQSLDFTGTNLKYIGDSAFSGCTSLTSLYVPDSLEYLGNGALSSIIDTYSASDGSKYLGNGDNTYLILVDVNTTNSTYSVNDNTKFIYDEAFKDCTTLTSIDLNNVIQIGSNAFSGCTGLKTIIIPESVKYLADDAFGDDTSIDKIFVYSKDFYTNNASSSFYYFTENGSKEYEVGNWWYYKDGNIIIKIVI